MSDSIKISKTLFVGLGGTGVKSILRAKQCFVDAYGEVPPMVAFLAIDTDRQIRNASLISRRGKEVRFAENEICFCGITGSALDIYRNHFAQFQWLPRRNATFLSNLRNTGAGAVRSNGRFLARHNSTEIAKRIAGKVTEIGRPLSIDSRFMYDTNKDGVEYPIKVNVVGSIAGGTGSGTMLDMLVLIAKTMRDSGLLYSITPWMVLPEVFRHMAPGPASANVFQNAYGAIRELDYLYHLPKDNQNALDFNFDKVYYLDEGIKDTYLINNVNRAGVVFQNIDDIADSIGRCMFLPSNEVDSVRDNTDNVRFVYNIKNKEAHYVSAGSAEIVYDNQAVGNVIARGIIANICNELCAPDSNMALAEVNAWMASEAVAIQEHNADLLIDSLLPKYPPFSVIVEKDTDETAVRDYISSGAEASYVLEEIRDKAARKFEVVRERLQEKVDSILNTQNGLAAAEDFLKLLTECIEVCEVEMNKEVNDLNRALAYDCNWGMKISSLRNGFFKIFDKDAAEVLQNEIFNYIAQKRDLLRHNHAIQFFYDLRAVVDKLSEKVCALKHNVESVAHTQMQIISTIQNLANSDSKFQIYLHTEDVSRYDLPNVEETSAFFRQECPIYTLVGRNEGDLNDIFFDFAKRQADVTRAVNISIEQKMSSMTEEQLRAIFAKVKEMSSPLWATNPHGYLDHVQEQTTVFTIGVYNQSSGIIKDKYIDEFTIGTIRPTFATTRETDRITFFQSQCYSPAYAVSNMVGYMRDSEEKSNQFESFPVSYLDETWNQRMITDNFSIMPRQEENRVLHNWVNAIVYGFIRYDESRRTYYIESYDQGDILAGGLLELGPRRDLAFDQFSIRGLDREVESRLQQMILELGRPAVTERIKAFQSNMRNYVSENAQLSAIELDRITANDPAYQMVRDLLEREVAYLRELDI